MVSSAVLASLVRDQVVIRWYTRCPASRILTIEVSPSVKRTILPERFATSAAFETAIPTSACLRAGESFTPSPVIPTI